MTALVWPFIVIAPVIQEDNGAAKTLFFPKTYFLVSSF